MKEAQELLDNRVFQSIRNILEQKAFEEWKNAHSIDERENLYARINTLDWLDSELRELASQHVKNLRQVIKE